MSKQAEKKTALFPITETSKFYLQEPYVYLINPGLLPKDLKIIHSFPIGKILPQFVQKMKETNDGIIDFHILGSALSHSVKIHQNKIEMVIKNQQKADIREARKRTQSQFDPSRTISYWFIRPRLILASHEQKYTFFEELLIAFEEIEQFEIKQKEKEKKKQEKKIEKEQGDKEKKPRRRRKLTVDMLSQFDYIMDFSLSEVDALTNEMLDIIIQSMKGRFFRRKKEVSFEKVVKIRIERMAKKDSQFSLDRAQIERVRSLLGLLYLIQDQYVEAWQDEDTFEIGLKPLEKATELFEGRD